MKSQVQKVFNVAINGASGNIAYALLPLFCNGNVFGPDVKINLKLLDLPSQQAKLTGTLMEIEDGAYPLINNVEMFFDVEKGLRDADVCVFIASHPHFAGMERSHLLQKNVEIYQKIGETMNKVASKDCKVVLVANPVNSLTTVLSKFAPDIPAKNFTALSRLDHNRAKWLIARTVKCNLDQIKELVVWGNHADTQFPDVSHVKVDGVPIKEILGDREEWLHTDYVDYCVNRWKKIVENRGVTSIMSPANAIKDHLRDWYLGTEPGDFVSKGVILDESKYGVPKGMCFSMPVECKDWNFKVVDFPIDQFTKDKINRSIEEISKELEIVGIKL